MTVESPGRDEQRLAELGYKQELTRAWSGFSNFAISFTIISILAGCFTTYGQAWNNGGPIAISWGWPLISCMILLVGERAGRRRLGLVHRLVQPRRPRRGGGVRRLRRRDVHLRAAESLERRP